MLSHNYSRREFLNAALMVGALAQLEPVGRALAIARRLAVDTLRVGVLLPDDASAPKSVAARRGIGLGTEESARTAALFGLAVDTRYEAAAPTATSTLAAARRLASQSVSALVVGLEGESSCSEVGELARAEGLAVVFLACAPQRPTSDACTRRLFYIAPSADTIERARRTGTVQAGARTHVELWHHTLRRFGAEQLNARFRDRFHVRMDSAAWAGWVSLKILTEAALRARTTTPPGIARYLARADVRFDGHKGEPLSFDARTGELRQPLYLVGAAGGGAERVVAELSPPTSVGPRRSECIDTSRGGQ